MLYAVKFIYRIYSNINRGGGTVFGLGKQTVNDFFENENFELILFSESENFGEANACFPDSAATA